MNLKGSLILAAIVAALSISLTKFYWPNVVEKTSVVEKEKTVKDVVTVIKEVSKPDGTKETVTTIVDKTKESKDSNISIVRMDKRNDWLFQVGAISNFKEKPDYQLTVNRRILGPILIGASYTTNKTLGLTIGLEF